MADIDARIQSLAQELQDHILDETLIAGIAFAHGAIVNITLSYKPPWQLQLNSRTRKLVEAWYYESRVFIIECLPDRSLQLMEALLGPLSTGNTKGLKEIRFKWPRDPSGALVAAAGSDTEEAIQQLNDVAEYLTSLEARLADGSHAR